METSERNDERNRNTKRNKGGRTEKEFKERKVIKFKFDKTLKLYLFETTDEEKLKKRISCY